MNKKIRRVELGKFFLDISKYVSTVVVIGTLVSEKVSGRVILVGLGTGIIFAVIGFLTLPKESDKEE